MIINSNVTAQVQFFDDSEMSPDSLMEVARDCLTQLINKDPNPRCDMEQIIAMLIVANGDF